MAEYTTPEFLLNRSTEELFNKIKAILPADIDLSEGGHAFNMTFPAALVAAEICELILPSAVQLMIPSWAYGTYLDEHAKARNIYRRAATAASGEVTITGTAGTVIPAGSLFSTAAVNDDPSVDYATTTAATIPETGSVNVTVRCTQTGIIGNTGPGTIVLVASKLTGITSVINAEEITGGTETETDDSLRLRVTEYDQGQGNSFTGCAADYKRWAESVAGVGEATVIPAQDDTGLVQIIITDANGAPANDELCQKVYDYIMSPGDPNSRQAPINALLKVSPPATINIGISATVELEEGATIESVKTALLARLTRYLPEALDDREIKFSEIWGALSDTEGIYDHTGLQIGIKTGDTVAFGTKNISVTQTELPTITADDITLTIGTV